MADRQFVAPFGNKQAPADWVLPASLEILPKLAYAHFDGTSAAGTFLPCLRFISDSGHVAVEAVSEEQVVAGASADVSWFPGVDEDITTVEQGAGVIVETLFVSSLSSSPVHTATVLTSGRTYLVTVQGTYTLRNVALTFGSPNPDAMYPTSGGDPRVSTQVGWDAETIFAESIAGTYPHHTVAFEMDLGDGLGLRHIEPVGGPFSAPQSGYYYTYQLVGAGHTLGLQISDSAYTDNYGELQVTVQTTGGSSSGGGGGSLLPDPTAQTDGQILNTSSGTAVWGGIDGGSP